MYYDPILPTYFCWKNKFVSTSQIIKSNKSYKKIFFEIMSLSHLYYLSLSYVILNYLTFYDTDALVVQKQN